MRIPNKVVLWGNDNSNTLAVLRQLASTGIDVDLVINKAVKFCATKSKFCRRYHVTKNFVEGLDYIVKQYSGLAPKPILFCTGDLSAEQIDQHRDELSKYFLIQGTAEQGLVTKVLDKNYMVALAEKHGIVIPSSIEYINGNYIKNTTGTMASLADINYPCLIKPSKNVQGEAKEFKTKVCNTEEELVLLLNGLNPRKTYMIQDYIRREYDVVIYGCKRKNGDVMIPGSAVRLRGGEDGDTTYGYLTPEIPAQVNIESIKNYLDDIGFDGVFSFEYGIKGDVAYFWEVNLRNDATSMWFGEGGANVPLFWVRDILGLDVDNVPLKIRKKQYFINEIEDFKHVKDGTITKTEWKKQLSGETLYKFMCFDDYAPYKWQKVYDFVRNIYHKLK